MNEAELVSIIPGLSASYGRPTRKETLRRRAPVPRREWDHEPVCRPVRLVQIPRLPDQLPGDPFVARKSDEKIQKVRVYGFRKGEAS
jgi:hypothetical protein